MRFSLRVLCLLLYASISFPFYPFTGEDAGTVGRRFGLEVENDLALFRYYDGSYQQDYVFQLNVGLGRRADLSLFVPYAKIWNGEEIEGIGDVGFFLKHMPYRNKDLYLGYKFQVNFDTGVEGIGYGKMTANLNLIAEYEMEDLIYNFNVLYTKASHIESLRDSYGFTIGVFNSYRKMLTYGAELTALSDEDKGTGKVDLHLILGCVYHANRYTDISLGFHKGLNKYESFANYGVLGGMKYSF